MANNCDNQVCVMHGSVVPQRTRQHEASQAELTENISRIASRSCASLACAMQQCRQDDERCGSLCKSGMGRHNKLQCEVKPSASGNKCSYSMSCTYCVLGNNHVAITWSMRHGEAVVGACNTADILGQQWVRVSFGAKGDLHTLLPAILRHGSIHLMHSGSSPVQQCMTCIWHRGKS